MHQWMNIDQHWCGFFRSAMPDSHEANLHDGKSTLVDENFSVEITAITYENN